MKKAEKAGFTIMELAIVVAIFLAMLVLLAPFVRMAKSWTRQVNCEKNLRRISLGLHRYAADRGEAFPTKLGELYPRYVTEKKAFDCPASAHIGTPDDPDYLYTAGLAESSPGETVIVRDKDGNHGRAAGSALTVGGAVVSTAGR